MIRMRSAMVLLLLAGVGCHRDDKGEKLLALERAYQSGVFTKDEYEAKKAALLGVTSPPPVPAAPTAVPSPVALPPISTPTPLPVLSVTPPPPLPTAAQKSRPADVAPKVQARNTPPPQPLPTPARAARERSNASPPPPAAPPPQAAPPRAPPVEPVRPQEPEREAEPAPTRGCEDAEGGKQKGALDRFYAYPEATVRKAARAALDNLDFNINKDVGQDIEATKRRHIGVLVGSGGEKVLLHFEKAQRGGMSGTLVTGETKKRFVGRLAQKSWTAAVLTQIGCQLRGR